MGSTTKVGSAPSLVPGAYVSSPMKATEGKAAERRDDSIRSTALSTSVTMSTAAPAVSKRPVPTAGRRGRRRKPPAPRRRTVELRAGVDVGRVGREHHAPGFSGRRHHGVADRLEVEPVSVSHGCSRACVRRGERARQNVRP